MPDGPFGPEQANLSGSIERRSAALDPLFHPTCLGIRCIPMPNPRKQRDNHTGVNVVAFRGHLRLKRAFAFRNVDQLIGQQDAALIPIKVMVNRVAPGRVRTPWTHPLVSDRGGGALPRVFSPVREPEIDVIASHLYRGARSYVIFYIKFVSLSILPEQRVN
jgi:hypothetical protein